MLNVLWDNAVESWEPVQPVQKDERKMVAECVEKKKLDEPFATRKRKQIGEKTLDMVDETVQTCELDHGQHEIGTVCKEEPERSYFKAVGSMCGVKCANCGASIVAEGDAVEGKMVKPTVTKPVMMCRSRETLGCRHAVCFTCFWNEIHKQPRDDSRKQLRRA